jgi:hypothetical protein
MFPMLDGFRSEMRRASDRSVVTAQQVTTPRPVVPFSEAGARELGHAYWESVARVSLGFVRCRERADRVELRLLGLGPPLLLFGGAELIFEDEHVSCSYRIRGGLLAHGETGTLRMSQDGRENGRLRVAVEGFFARLGGGRLYGLQHRLHLAISRRYFSLLLRDHVA